ncbi:MAG: hypothetical protein IKN64_02870 [Desulfovibrio sp.]|nr:hypothetical protein [Desulfovibrio sp.]
MADHGSKVPSGKNVWMWVCQGIPDPPPSLTGQQAMPPSPSPVGSVDIFFGRMSMANFQAIAQVGKIEGVTPEEEIFSECDLFPSVRQKEVPS